MAYPRAESKIRLKQAVRRNRVLSREGLLEQVFERLFRGLVYTQIWEDPEIDLEALALGPDNHVVAIASGGCNVLSYLTAGPARILGLPVGSLEVGAAADVCIFDPGACWNVDENTWLSRGRNTPFLGQTMRGLVRYTLLGGIVVYGNNNPAG